MLLIDEIEKAIGNEYLYAIELKLNSLTNDNNPTVIESRNLQPHANSIVHIN